MIPTTDYNGQARNIYLNNLMIKLADLKKAGVKFGREVMYRTGYIYRYWHYYTGENSKDICTGQGVTKKLDQYNYILFEQSVTN